MTLTSLFFGFKGRISRLEYFVVCSTGYASALLSLLLHTDLVRLLALILGFWIMTAAVAKRLHDMDVSGLHAMWQLVPVAGIVQALGLLLIEGTDGPNSYGDSEKSKPP